MRCDVQTDGVQPISWIETDSGELREARTRGMGFGYVESLEGSAELRSGLKTMTELMEE